MSAKTMYQSKENQVARRKRRIFLEGRKDKAKFDFPRYTTDPNPETGELGYKFVGPKKQRKF